MQRRYDTYTLDLFAEFSAVIMRYRGWLPRKTQKIKNAENLKLLNSMISGEWQNAKELSDKTGVRFHQAVRLLKIAAYDNNLETKLEEWIDDKHRSRVRTLYRKQKRGDLLLAEIMGMKVYDGPHSAANTRKHVCRGC